MTPTLPGSTQQYLANLGQIGSEMTGIQTELSSGYKINSLADDPYAVGSIAATQGRIAQLQQSQTDLAQVQTELQSGDSAIQTAIQQLDRAVTLASQAGSNTLASPPQNAAMLAEVQAIQQNLVNLSATSAGGRYIFSGDLDQQPLYAVDPTQPTGVKQLATTTSTRVITDANGTQVWLAKTATDIFDARNPDTTPASDNVFAAVNALATALQNNDQAGALASITNLKAASDHLNQEAGYYGVGETNVSDAINAAATAVSTQQQALGSLRDADVAGAAVQLSQLTLEQQAALSARAKISSTNLFDFIA